MNDINGKTYLVGIEEILTYAREYGKLVGIGEYYYIDDLMAYLDEYKDDLPINITKYKLEDLIWKLTYHTIILTHNEINLLDSMRDIFEKRYEYKDIKTAELIEYTTHDITNDDIDLFNYTELFNKHFTKLYKTIDDLFIKTGMYSYREFMLFINSMEVVFNGNDLVLNGYANLFKQEGSKLKRKEWLRKVEIEFISLSGNLVTIQLGESEILDEYRNSYNLYNNLHQHFIKYITKKVINFIFNDFYTHRMEVYK